MNDDEMAHIIHTMTERGITLAVAESLTGGAVTARLVDIPGASAVLRGGVCTYASDLKADILGVDQNDLARTGPVDAAVAEQMAAGVKKLMNADIGIATTGVAGPSPADGHPAGTVYVACAYGDDTNTELLRFDGGRSAVRRATVDAVLHLLAKTLNRYCDAL